MPEAFRDKVVVAKSNMTAEKRVDVDAVITLAKNLYDELYKDDVPTGVSPSSLSFNAITGNNNRSASSSSASSRSPAGAHNDVHHSSNRSKWAHFLPESRRLRGLDKKGKGRARGSGGSGSGDSFECAIHGSCGHTTADCEVLSKANASLLVGGGSASGSASGSSSSSFGPSSSSSRRERGNRRSSSPSSSSSSLGRAGKDRPWFPK
ncbi:hypothetical protein ABG067_008140, partial [Albugo candida]